MPAKIPIPGKVTPEERQQYTYTTFTPSDALSGVDGLGAKKSAAESAYDTHINNGFTYSNQTAYEDVLKRLNNGEKFSYDLNGDALYQQYKDKYIQQGKMAMADTMGQAAAMTGGYGNSYAASVGNQAYQASLQNLNDVSLQLYQMAYDRYAQDRQDLYNQFGALSTDKNTEYGMWSDKGNMLGANRTYWGTEYDSAYNRELTEHTASEGLKQADIADANSYAQWLANFNEGVRQYDNTMAFNKAQANKPTGTTTVTTPTLTAEEYNDVLLNAGDYASQSETALANYLNGLVARGLSPDEAAAIYEQYFPSNIPTAPGKKKGNVATGGGRQGNLLGGEIHVKN